MKKSVATRRTPSSLVKSSVPTVQKTKKWTELLSRDDGTYILQVVTAMKATPGAAHYMVAKGLKEELSLSVSVGTIAKTLKEMIDNG
jgi:hypothetical protein